MSKDPDSLKHKTVPNVHIFFFFYQNTYFSVSEHSASFSLLKKKYTILVSDCGVDPPFTDQSATISF